MLRASKPTAILAGAADPSARNDRIILVPLLACAYTILIYPLLNSAADPGGLVGGTMQEHPENKLFWPAIAVATMVLVVQHRARLAAMAIPVHIRWLAVYVGFAAASVVWALKPELSAVRFAQQAMVVGSIVLPALIADRRADLLRGVFHCFALAALINVLFVMGNSPVYVELYSGYPGYFTGKNYLGQFAALVFLLSLHEVLHSGARRIFGIGIALTALFLLVLSNSKTAFALALFIPLAAGVTMAVRRKLGISPAIQLLILVCCYIVFSALSGFTTNRLSYMIYGDSTFTGRQLIWDFAFSEIDRRPILGWGYQSFWLVGADGPSVTDAPGWIKGMPNAHNGYYDTLLELGYVGLVILLIFLATTLHVIGGIVDTDAKRAWALLSLALYVMAYNFLESAWMRGFDYLWVVFVLLAAEAARQWRPATERIPARVPRRPQRDRGLPPRQAIRQIVLPR